MSRKTPGWQISYLRNVSQRSYSFKGYATVTRLRDTTDFFCLDRSDGFQVGYVDFVLMVLQNLHN